jgi:2-polyprenyl-3-methyl-5-hydroxy-6-metoxy-1,4-benzoquinol methylase
MINLIRCDLCNGKKITEIIISNDLMYDIKKKYSITQCKSCGLMFLNPQPSIKDLEDHYPKDYYSFYKETKPISKFEMLLYRTYCSSSSNIFLKFFLLPFKRTIRSINIPSISSINIPSSAKKSSLHPKILDVGCGSGNFLRKAKELGFECYGVEPGEFDRIFAKKNGFKIYSGTLKQAKFDANFFDDITFNHVYEHVNNPLSTLKESKRILKKGGIIQITVPQKRSLAFWIFGKYWVQLDVPRHLFIHNESTLRGYAKKAGLEVKSVRYVSSPFQFTGSLVYLARKYNLKLLEKFFNSRIFFLALFPLSSICNFFKIGDSIEIVLNK